LEKTALIADEIKRRDKKGWTIPGRFITPRIATSTGNCVISGVRTSQRLIPIRPDLRTIGFTTPMSL
jgi:hypothetical protein